MHSLAESPTGQYISYLDNINISYRTSTQGYWLGSGLWSKWQSLLWWRPVLQLSDALRRVSQVVFPGKKILNKESQSGRFLSVRVRRHRRHHRVRSHRRAMPVLRLLRLLHHPDWLGLPSSLPLGLGRLRLAGRDWILQRLRRLWCCSRESTVYKTDLDNVLYLSSLLSDLRPSEK